MASSTYRRPGAFSPMPSGSNGSQQPRRTESSESDSSSSSNLTSLSVSKAPLNQPQPQAPRPPYTSANSNGSTTSVNSIGRLSIAHVFSDIPSRKNSPLNPSPGGHKRQHSQGFFEPSLPTASHSEQAPMANLTASQIAAQAAMHHQSSAQHVRKRSQTVPSPQTPPEDNRSNPGRPGPLRIVHPGATRKPSATGQQIHLGPGGGHATAATAAAAAYPRSAQVSPNLSTFDHIIPEREPKLKTERSKIKLFSKPKNIVLPGHAGIEKALPSPNKVTSPGPSVLSNYVNASTTSLVDPSMSSASSIYSSANASTSTLVPLDRQRNDDKDKKHHFLSRQKNKLKDKIEDHPITLSSASSNSRPLDPHAPQSLYSFVPSSPGPNSTSFAKTVSGLDLRHGGRALREKKKEEKAMAMPPPESRRSDVDRTDWVPSVHHASPAAHSFLGPQQTSSSGIGLGLRVGDTAYGSLQGFGLNNMGPDDAWPYLKAKLLIIFEGEELRTPIEDLNRLVTVHIQRCMQKRSPTAIMEDLRELLETGFLSLDQNLRGIPDERLVPHLVELWIHVFSSILPYLQAVFLPLDLEFRGNGSILSEREALEFWGVSHSHDPSSSLDAGSHELDVRRILLLTFRDTIILARYEALKSLFSRLSLESINPVVDFDSQPGSGLGSPGFRPGTAHSLDPHFASFNSQSSTLLDSASSASRSRAVSNTSAPELPSFAPQAGRRPALHHPSVHASFSQSSNNAQGMTLGNDTTSQLVTQTVARMLQCVSVLASVRSGDEAQKMMEDLAKELKLNWLGRGRTGRNRRGFVGTRVNRSGTGGSVGGGTAEGDGGRVGSLL